ncbi:MAG: hypothetical protein MJ252_01395 [archaeon]|nr:hypothetical protein [archaeon]
MEKTQKSLDRSKVIQVNAIDFLSPTVLNNPRPSKIPKKIDSLFFSQMNESFVILSK